MVIRRVAVRSRHDGWACSGAFCESLVQSLLVGHLDRLVPGSARQNEDGLDRDCDELSRRVADLDGIDADSSALVDSYRGHGDLTVARHDRPEIVDLQIERREGRCRRQCRGDGDVRRCVCDVGEQATVDGAIRGREPCRGRYGDPCLTLRRLDDALADQHRLGRSLVRLHSIGNRLGTGSCVPVVLSTRFALYRACPQVLEVRRRRLESGSGSGQRLRVDLNDDAAGGPVGEHAALPVLEKHFGQAECASRMNQPPTPDDGSTGSTPICSLLDRFASLGQRFAFVARRSERARRCDGPTALLRSPRSCERDLVITRTRSAAENCFPRPFPTDK